MGKRNSKGGSKKSKSKKRREKNNKSNLSKQQETSQKPADEYVSENIAESSAEQNGNSDTNSDEGILENNDINIDESILGNNETNTTESTSETNSTNNTTNETNDCYEEMKAKQQELINKVKNLSESLAAITLIRDNVNSIRVDTLTELYFTRQVRPLLDALNILSFAVSNMSTAAVNIQTNTFGDRAEIRHALKLSYKMNDEVEDIINAFERRLKIFIALIDNMDKNCPPFDFKRDS